MTRTESLFVSIPRKTILPFAGRAADPVVVRLRGEYDVSTAVGLWEALARAMTHDDGDLVIDLSAVEFMDAATVGVIVRAANHLRQRSRSLALRCPSRAASRIVDLCGLAGLVEADPGEIRRMPSIGALDAWVTTPATDRVVSAGDISAETGLSAPDFDLQASGHVMSVAVRRGR